MSPLALTFPLVACFCALTTRDNWPTNACLYVAAQVLLCLWCEVLAIARRENSLRGDCERLADRVVLVDPNRGKA